ncbi:hypothetical protein D3C77_00430 [compost metagenome]|uniref:hypothetical protein n=1 Tax=Pseudomonas TaxID=286 RepID=UPI000FC1D38F|nr:hypothetical protein [Pseudomonas sp. MYb187]
MSDAHHRFQLKACRTFALKQNQRLFHQAWHLDHQAFALLDHPQLDAETFTQYQRLRHKASDKYLEAIEHLHLINRDFADPLPALREVRTYLFKPNQVPAGRVSTGA